MFRRAAVDKHNGVVPRTGYVDRNLPNLDSGPLGCPSYPARGTWIEMPPRSQQSQARFVVPRTGYVDRNTADRYKISGEPGRTPHGVRG